MTLGDNIKRIRELAGLNQDEVYPKIPVSRATYSKWENNSAEIGLKHVKKLSEILDVPLDELMMKKGENLTPEPKLEQGNNYDLSHMNTAIQSLLMTIDSMKQDIKRLEREVEQLKLAGKRNE